MKNIQIVYDFDGTLTPKSIPMFQILKENGFTEESFEKGIEEYRKLNDEDIYQSWFTNFLNVCNTVKLTNENIALGAKDVEYNPGLLTYFDNVNDLANNESVSLKHYIVSSGIKEYLKKTTIASYIENIFATTFKYDENNIARGIDYLAKDQKKVDAIKNINISNNREENDCTNLIYLGDGLTDYYAMDFVINHGGISILVTPNGNEPNEKLFNVSSAMFKADYSNNSELYLYITDCIKKTIY
jgi:Putative Phosphatase.